MKFGRTNVANSSADSLFKSFLEEASPSPAPLPENSEPSPDLVSSFLSTSFDPQEEQDLDQRILEQAPSRALLSSAESAMLSQYEQSQTEGPIQYGGTFENAFQAGLENMSANTSYFTALLGDAFGNTEMGDRGIMAAEAASSRAAASLAEIDGPQSFTELMEAPTLSDALTYAISTTGQFAPSAIASITAAITGSALFAVLGPAAAATAGVGGVAAGAAGRGATREAIKRLVRRTVNKKIKGEKLSKAENDVINLSFKHVKEYGLKNVVAANRGAVGGLAGAFSQEFTQGSGILYGDFAEQDMRGGRAAALSLLGGGAYGLIGTTGEAIVVKGLKDSLTRLLKESGSKSFTKRVAAGIVDVGKRGAVGEGTAEFLQEGVSITQKLNIDDAYTRVMARSDAINALVAGAVGGGVIGGTGGAMSGAVSAAAPRIQRKSAEYVDRFSQGQEQAEINAALDLEEFGIDLSKDFIATPESSEDLSAQYAAMMDPKTKKDSMFIPIPEKGAPPNLDPIIQKDIDAGKVFRVDVEEARGRGLFLSTDEEKANRLMQILMGGTAKGATIPEKPEEAQLDLFEDGPIDLDTFLADALGYSAVRRPDDPNVLEVVDKEGNFVHFQSVAEGKEAMRAAAQKAQDMFGKLGKDQDYMYYQDFHNQINKDGKTFPMRTIESHMQERNTKFQNSLVDQMANSIMFDEEVSAQKAEADDSAGTADDVGKASLLFELSEDAVKRTLYTKIRKGGFVKGRAKKSQATPSWAPYLDTTNKNKDLKEQFLKALEERDPIFSEQMDSELKNAKSIPVQNMAERIAESKGITFDEALAEVESKINTTLPEDLQGKPMSEITEMLGGTVTPQSLDYRNNPDNTVISEENLQDIRENVVRALQTDKKNPRTLPEAQKEAKEKFPDTLIGDSILKITPPGVMKEVIALSQKPEFDSVSFEVAVADRDTEIPGAEFVETKDIVGRFVINLVSQDPAKALSLVQDKEIVEYAMAEAIESGLKDYTLWLEYHAKKTSYNTDGYTDYGRGPLVNYFVTLKSPGTVLDVGELELGSGVSPVLETQLAKAKEMGFDSKIPVDATRLTGKGLSLMNTRGLTPIKEDLNTADARVRYFADGFLAILYELGNQGYKVEAYNVQLPPRSTVPVEYSYDLIDGLNTTFPEVVAGAKQENVKGMISKDIEITKKRQETIALNETIAEEAAAFFNIKKETAEELTDNEIKNRIKNRLLDLKRNKNFATDIGSPAATANSILALIDKRDGLTKQIKEHKTPEERIEEVKEDPEIQPSKVFKNEVLSPALWKAIKYMPFFTKKAEENVFLTDYKKGQLSKRLDAGPKAQKGFKDKDIDKSTGEITTAIAKEYRRYTLSDFINSFDKDPISSVLRKLRATEARIGEYRPFDPELKRQGKKQQPTKLYHPTYGTVVTYVGEIYKEDLALQKELAAEMETLGYTKIKAPKRLREEFGISSTMWVPGDKLLELRQAELLDQALKEDIFDMADSESVARRTKFKKELKDKLISMASVDPTVRYNEAEKLYGAFRNKLATDIEKLEGQVKKTPEDKKLSKKLNTLKKQKKIIDNVFNEYTPDAAPTEGITVPVVRMKTVFSFNTKGISSELTSILRPALNNLTQELTNDPAKLEKEKQKSLQKAIEKIKDLKEQAETGQIVIQQEERKEITGKEAEKYIADQKRLGLFKFGKKATGTKKTLSMPMPFVPIAVPNVPWTWEAEMAEKYWEPVGKVEPNLKYRNAKVLSGNQIKKLEKQLKEDGAIILETKPAKIVKGKELASKMETIEPFEITEDGRLFYNEKDMETGENISFEVKVLEEDTAIDTGTTVVLPTYEHAKLKELDRGYVTVKEAKQLQDNEKFSSAFSEAIARKGKKAIEVQVKAKTRENQQKKNRLFEWDQAQSLNLSGVIPFIPKAIPRLPLRSVGSDLPGQRTKYYLPNFSKTFLEQAERASKAVGVDKIFKGGAKNYMDVLFATIGASFDLDPKVRTLVISATEDINENPVLAGIDESLKNTIQSEQRAVNLGTATTKGEKQKRENVMRMSGRTASALKSNTFITDHGNNVISSRIRVNGGLENIIILKVSPELNQQTGKLAKTINRNDFLFSISKAFGHEIGHIVLDSESNWTNDVAVIFKNRPAFKEAYIQAIKDPNLPELTKKVWTDPQKGASEWFADNFSAAMNKNFQAKTGVESMFKRLANMFKRAWENIADFIQARFNVDTPAYKMFENELNKIIKEHRAIKASEAVNPNRWELTSTEALVVENMKQELLTWENLGGRKGAKLNESVISTVLKAVNEKVPVNIAKLFYDADNFLRTKLGPAGKALALMFYGKSQSGEQQGFLQRVVSLKNSNLTEFSKVLLDQEDADWGMLQSENPDLLAVEDSNNNTYQMELVPVLNMDRGIEHAEAHPEYIYLYTGAVPKGYTVPKNMYEMPPTGKGINARTQRGFAKKMRRIVQQDNKRGFIVVGKRTKGTANLVNSLQPRRMIPVLSGKKAPANTTPKDWAWWENRYVSNIGVEKGQVTGRQFKLRQKMEQFYWDNKLAIHGVAFRENYWPRMFDFVEIGATPELRTKLTDLLLEANTANNTTFRRQIIAPVGVNPNTYFENVKSGKLKFPGGKDKKYIVEEVISEDGFPILDGEGNQMMQYFEFFKMDREFAEHLVDQLADGPQESFDSMENDGDTFIGHQLGLGVLPHRAKAFAALDTSVLRKEKLIVDPAIATDRSINQIFKKIEYDTKGGWQTAAQHIEDIKDPKLQEDALKAVKHLLGKYDQNMSPEFRTFNSWALFMNIASLLAFATFASLPDFAGAIMRAKDSQALKNVVPVLLEMAGNPAAARALAKDIGVVASEAMELMWIHSPQMDWQTHGSQRASSIFFKYTGLEAFTKFTRYFAAGMGKQFIVHHSKNAKTGSGLSKARSIRYLKELNNISPDVALKWEKNGFSFDSLSAQESREMKLALARFVDESIVRPSAAERPVWASDPRYALIWQLKSFFYAYGKNILGGVAREAQSRKNETGSNLEAVVPLLMMASMVLPLTMLGWDLRERTKYAIAYAIPWQDADWNKIGKTDQMPWGPYLTELIDRSGALGPWTMLRQMYTKAQWGELWITPILGPSAEVAEEGIAAAFTDKTFNFKKRLPLGQLAQ
tara:strand:+ start:3866 stop:13270 length:9405 start_codon:yes stop_codon:yes gene_type:complete